MLRIDPKLTALLDSLRQRVRRYIVWDSLLGVLAVLLLAFWLGMLLDYVPVRFGGTEMPRSARTVLLVAVAGFTFVLLVQLLIRRLIRPLPGDSLALLIERSHPDLGGRLVTAVQLARPRQEGDQHSEALLQRVHQEARDAVDQVDQQRVFRSLPLVQKSLIVTPLLLAVVVLAVVSPQTVAQGAARLTLFSDAPWPRRAKLEMVGVEVPVVAANEDPSLAPELVTFNDKSVALPRGSDCTLRIRALADGAEVPNSCTLYYQTDEGSRGQSNFRRVGRVVDGYQTFVLDGPPLAGLSQSMTVSIRGLDDRLDGFRIEAKTPPTITSLVVQSRYPDYLRAEGAADVDFQIEYQSGLRIREGSDVTLVGQTSQPIASVDLAVSGGDEEESPPVTVLEDRKQFRVTLANFDASTTVKLVPRSTSGISAQVPLPYFLGVVLDEPPEIDYRLVGIGSAITPIARLPMTLTASDDYGVRSTEVRVKLMPGSEEPPAASDPKIATEIVVAPELSRDGSSQLAIDLRKRSDEKQFALPKPGDIVTLFADAADAYDLVGEHVTRSEVYRLEVVTPGQLLALLERRELGLRSRLEQTIDEARGLRESLDALRLQAAESARKLDQGPSVAMQNTIQGQENPEKDLTREVQIRRLRVQQSGLQANKTSEELTGISANLTALLEEMVNNRVDSVDRRERLAGDVRDPLDEIVDGPMQQLRDQIIDLESSVESSPATADKAAVDVQHAETV
ncbi:MAG: polyketide synthase, partial [Planctomycetota bacterium]